MFQIKQRYLPYKMKKSILLVAAAFGVFAAQAQETTQAIATPKLTDNIQVGIDGGALAPLKGGDFFKDIRGGFGIHVDKMITPTFGMGIEGYATINTSSWEYNYGGHSQTAIDNSYVGLYGRVNLFNLFGGYKCEARKFDIDLIAGAGWGCYYNSIKAADFHNYSYFATKAGLSFNYNINKNLTVSLKPSVVYNMSNADTKYHSAAYDARLASFNLFASVAYNINPGFNCVRPYDQAEVDALNAQINDLRSQLDGCVAASNAWQAKANGLAAELAACEARKAVVKEVVSNTINSVRYVFYRVGSSKIQADQQPNIEMIAKYLKNHPDAKLIVKGYASPEGSAELNAKLAAARAEAVKTALVKKYKVAADRITAQGEGVGNMFEEDSWNRVAVCTLDK